MTDYMEAILREQEEQGGRRTEHDWRKAWEEDALPVPEQKEAGRGRGTGEEGMDGGPENRTAAGSAGGAAEAFAPKTGERPGEAGEGAGRGPWGDVDAESRAALPGEWLYRALRQSLTELPPPRRESRVVTLQKPGEKLQPGSWDAAGLDRLVRRDARRFDGGFQLL